MFRCVHGGSMFRCVHGGSMFRCAHGGSMFRCVHGGSMFRCVHGGSMFRCVHGGSMFRCVHWDSMFHCVQRGSVFRCVHGGSMPRCVHWGCMFRCVHGDSVFHCVQTGSVFHCTPGLYVPLCPSGPSVPLYLVGLLFSVVCSAVSLGSVFLCVKGTLWSTVSKGALCSTVSRGLYIPQCPRGFFVPVFRGSVSRCVQVGALCFIASRGKGGGGGRRGGTMSYCVQWGSVFCCVLWEVPCSTVCRKLYDTRCLNPMWSGKIFFFSVVSKAAFSSNMSMPWRLRVSSCPWRFHVSSSLLGFRVSSCFRILSYPWKVLCFVMSMEDSVFRHVHGGSVFCHGCEDSMFYRVCRSFVIHGV